MFVFLVNPLGICSYSISCRLYQIKPKLIHFRIWWVTLYTHKAHVPNYSYITWVITFKIYLACSASVKLSPVSSANNKMPFYSLQNCSRLAVFNNVRMCLWGQGMVNLGQFTGLRRDSNFLLKNSDRMRIENRDSNSLEF